MCCFGVETRQRNGRATLNVFRISLGLLGGRQPPTYDIKEDRMKGVALLWAERHHNDGIE